MNSAGHWCKKAARTSLLELLPESLPPSTAHAKRSLYRLQVRKGLEHHPDCFKVLKRLDSHPVKVQQAEYQDSGPEYCKTTFQALYPLMVTSLHAPSTNTPSWTLMKPE